MKNVCNLCVLSADTSSHLVCIISLITTALSILDYVKIFVCAFKLTNVKRGLIVAEYP